MRNTFGNILTLTTFGESHGPAMGGIIDGFPAGVAVDLEQLQRFVRLRRPGQSRATTQRNEADQVEILSGIYQGKTLGTPIGFVVRNTNQRSADYDAIAQAYRPNHADYTCQLKYGTRDPRGGGRSSARETVSRVVAGGLALQALALRGITVEAHTSQIGDVALAGAPADPSLALTNDVRCPNADVAARMQAAIDAARRQGDSLGGVVSLTVQGLPVGLGEPAFSRLNTMLYSALASIPAVKGIEQGDGFAMAAMPGSQALDNFVPDGRGGIALASNHCGGTLGGISSGQPVVMRVAFKPTPTLGQPVATVTASGEPTTLTAGGRHDPCVVPRAVPVVQAMAALAVLDALLLGKTTIL